MKKHYLACVVALTFTTSALASSNIYFTGGVGAVFPAADSSYTSDSSSVLYSPTAPGSSLFTLPAVNWKNQYQTGIDLNAAIGYQLSPQFRTDIEFVYQNTERRISGQYNWREQNAANGSVYATSNNNPITPTTVTTNVYSLLANAYFDLQTNSKWTPSIGGGVGLAWISSDSTNTMNVLNVDDPATPLLETAPVSQSSGALNGTALALQLKLGVAYAFSDSTSIALIYRLLSTGQFRSGNSYIVSNPGMAGESTFNVSQHNVTGLLNNSLELSVRFNV